MLMRLDGVASDYKGRRTDKDFEVVQLWVREKPWGVGLDVSVTPLVCLQCRRQLTHFYYWDGSRYGQVGTVDCDHCGADIHCVDSDAMRYYLHTSTCVNGTKVGQLTLNYPELYQLQPPVWNAIKLKTGYDIYSEHAGQQVSLELVLWEIYLLLGYEPADQHPPVITEPLITRLPDLITSWVRLLQHLEHR